MWSPEEDSTKENCENVVIVGHSKWYGPSTPSKAARQDRSPRNCPRLCLTLFAKTPRLSFAKVKIGNSKLKRVIVDNPLSVAQSLHLDKWPEKKGFKILKPVAHGETLLQNNDGSYETLPRCSDFTVPAFTELDLPILWEPETEGNYRETVTLKLGDINRLQIVLFGSAIDTAAKPKHKMKELLPKDVRKLNTSQKRKISTTNTTTKKISPKKVLQESNQGLPVAKDINNSSVFTNTTTTEDQPERKQNKQKSSNTGSSKRSFRARVASQGVAPSRLNLTKSIVETRNMPRHPLPFAAKNMYFDEKWIEKQERGFVQWLNYILTPPDDESTNQDAPDTSSIFLMEGSSNDEVTKHLAPTKEVLSLRTYTAKRKMTRLRRSACLLYQSPPVAMVTRTIEGEVEKDRLCIRSDKHFHKDLGIKETILNMLLSYNCLWLRIGIETVYGEILPLHSNNDIAGLRRFLRHRFLANADIAKHYRHTTIAEYYRPGYYEALEKFTLKKFLLLVLFLDKAKLTRLIDHDPCLFNKTSQYKSSRDLLVVFSREYLKGEGDITKHLSFLNYTVTHTQLPLDEMDYAVKNLAVDLRDGLRITRVIELLTQNWTLSSRLRVPAISRLQKIHNIGVALNELKERGDVFNDEKNIINPRNIVDGHREKTLSFLWFIILHFQVNLVVNEKRLREETAFLKKYHRMTKIQSKDSNNCCEDNDVYGKTEKLGLLLDWCRTVCRLYNVKVENFTVSMCDGRVLCYLLHYYHPCLIRQQDICHETTQTCNPYTTEEEGDEISDDSLIEDWKPVLRNKGGEKSSKNRLQELKENERKNHELCNKKVQELGGVPCMLRFADMCFADMSSTIPDEKVVVTYISYLCARLLELKDEGRAARTIQSAWRKHQREKRAKEGKRKHEAVTIIQRNVRRYLMKKQQQELEHSALIIQSYFRGYQVRRNVTQRHHAAALIQTRYEAYKVMQETRRNYNKLRDACIKIQALVRGMICRRNVQKLRAAVVIQSHWRKHQARRLFLLLKNTAVLLQARVRHALAHRAYQQLKMATVIIQERYRALRIARKTRQRYEQLRNAAVFIQTTWRGILSRRQETKFRAANVIQKSLKMWRYRRVYLEQKRAVVKIQSHVRRILSERRYHEMVLSARVIQVHWKAYLSGKGERRGYEKTRRNVILVQALWRKRVARKDFLIKKDAAILLQACVRGYSTRKMIEEWKIASCVIQKYYRGYLMMKNEIELLQKKRSAIVTLQASYKAHVARVHYTKVRRAIVVIQATIRGYVVREEIRRYKKACSTIQSYYRGYRNMEKQRELYKKKREAVIKIQASFRAYLKRQEYLHIRKAIILIQSRVRGDLVRKEMTERREACSIIQSYYRGYIEMKRLTGVFNQKREAVIKIQASFRAYTKRQEYLHIRKSIILIQSCVRGCLVRKEMDIRREACSIIQSYYRGYIEMKRLTGVFNQKREAVIKIQASFRAYTKRQEYLHIRKAIILIQSRVRGDLVRKEMTEHREACSIIQSYYRGYIEMKRLTGVFNQKREAVIKIQASFRAYTKRQEYLHIRKAIILIQSRVRGCLVRKEMKKRREACSIIQSYYKGYRDMKEQCIFYKKKKEAIARLQALFRGHQCRVQYLKTREAVITIQAFVRGYITRNELREQTLACLVIQKYYRGYRRMKDACDEFKQKRDVVIKLQALHRCRMVRTQYCNKKKAAVIIQAFVRGYEGRKRYTQIQHAVHVLQLHYRAHQAMLREREQYVKTRDAVITLQALFRGHMTRKQQQLMHNAATMIQSHYRRVVARTRYLHLQQCTKIIHMRYKAWCTGKKVQQEYKKLKQATITLQKHVRGKQVRKEVRAMTTAASVIQTRYRGYRDKKRYLKLKESALVVQRRYRALMLTRAARVEYVTKRACAVLIQSHVRRFLCARQFHVQRNAVCTLQTRWRAVLVSRRARMRYQHIVNSITKIQAFVRGYHARKVVRRERAVIKIQACWRSLQQRRLYVTQCRALVKIQAWYKMVRQRRSYLLFLEHIVYLQQLVRANQQCSREMINYAITRGAIITLQAGVRGYMVRKEQREKSEQVIKIQAWFRRHIAEQRYTRLRQTVVLLQQRRRATLVSRETQVKYQQLRYSTIILQSHVRKMIEQRRYQQTYSTIIRLQAAVRCFIATSRYTRLRHATMVIQRSYRARMVCLWFNYQRGACITLQASTKAWIARRRYLEIKRATRVIQIRYQATMVSKKQQLEYQKIRCAVTTIQATIRAWIVRQKYTRLRQAVVVIQACVRRVLERKKYTRLRQAVVVIQKRQRAMVLGKCERHKFLLERRCAVVIQSRYRGHRERMRFIRMKNAAVKIQAWLRCERSRNVYQQMRHSVIVIQSFVKCYQEKKRYLMYRHAVIKIQALQRMKQERRNYEILRYTTIQLQRRVIGNLLCRHQRIKYQQLRNSVIRLQSLYRGRKARENVSRMKAANVIQQRYRAYLRGRRMRDWFTRVQTAVVMIQSHYRGHVARKHTSMERSARIIQALVRGYQTRRMLEKRREEQAARLTRFSAAVYANLMIIRLQRGFRKARAIALFKAKMDRLVFLQRWWRAKLQRLEYLRQKHFACIIQRWWRRQLVIKTKAVVKIQALFRCVLAKRYARKRSEAMVVLQSHVRGYLVRKHCKSVKVKKARQRLQQATSRVTEAMKLCNRTRSALDYLLKCKNLSTVLGALINLEVATRLSHVCSERLVMDNALSVIFKVVRTANRSLADIELIKHSLTIFINVSKCPTTKTAVVYHEPNSLETLLDLTCMFREKSEIFQRTCSLLTILCQHESIRQELFDTEKAVSKLKSVYTLTKRKHDIDIKRNKQSKHSIMTSKKTSNSTTSLHAITELVSLLGLVDR